MAASNTDKFIKAAVDWTGAVGAGGVADGVVTTVPLVSVTGLPTDTAVQITIDRVDANGTATPAKKEVITGVVSSTNIIDCIRGVEGTAQAHSAGAVVEVMLTATQFNNEIDAILVEHEQDGKHIAPATAKTSIVDADLFGIFDSAASFIFKKITWDNLKATLLTWLRLATTIIPINSPEGFLINGKIVVTDAAGITVAIKGMDGNDPSVSNPVYCRINGVVRSITAALSVTKADGTNWMNAGSAELATKEIDYFVYLGYNATDGVVIGFSRIPFANSYDDFSATTTNEKYCAISTITNAAATDYYNVIGRFAATLSAGAGYTWSVPTFTAKNLIQRPIYETRVLSIAGVYTGFSGTPTTSLYNYHLIGKLLYWNIQMAGISNATGFNFQFPFASIERKFISHNRTYDNGVIQNTAMSMAIIGSSSATMFREGGASTVWTASGTKSTEANGYYEI